MILMFDPMNYHSYQLPLTPKLALDIQYLTAELIYS